MSRRATVMFEGFGLAEYDAFLRAKAVPEFELVHDADGMSAGISVPARFAHMVGASVTVEERARLELPGFLFPDQKAIVGMALDAERFACWSDCGLGKTLIELEFARQVVASTGGRVLIFTLPDVVREIVDQAGKFFGEDLKLEVISSRAAMREWCKGPGPAVGITNYEKMNPSGQDQVVREMGELAGVILDESSRLKTGGGKQKWALIKSTKGVRYKLSCTATPAPNEVMEFASQAAFLERIRGESEVIWTYFTRDPVSQEWTVKEHARPHFFRWMASWSIYVRDPAAYGWKRKVAAVPEPVFIEHRIEPTLAQIKLAHAEAAKAGGTTQPDLLGEAQSLGIVGQGRLSQAAKGFLYAGDDVEEVESRKPGFVARLIRDEVKGGLAVLVWCIFDAEVDVLSMELRRMRVRHAALGGSSSRKLRAATIEEFRVGGLPVLIAKASMLGYGYNLQHVGSMVFSGFNDSFEAFYQAVRRAYRFGQRRRLRVHLPFLPILEEPILRNVLRKAANFEAIIAEQERAYVEAYQGLRCGLKASQAA